MSKFIRGIKNEKFIIALNEVRKDSSSYWYKILNDKELFIAIRNESINVYFKGNSICKLIFSKGQIIGKTHYKYLLLPDLNKYVDTTALGVYTYPGKASMFVNSLNDIEFIKKASSIYAGEEKTGVHSIVYNKYHNILDLEISFSDVEDAKDRMDFMQLVGDKNSNLKLVFYEAKCFTNSEIRSKTGEPKVLAQMERYKRALQINAVDIVESYKLVSKNIKQLNIVGKRNLINCIDDETILTIDPMPHLIIFGFDQDQKRGSVWTPHFEALRKRLNGNVKIIGNVKNL